MLVSAPRSMLSSGLGIGRSVGGVGDERAATFVRDTITGVISLLTVQVTDSDDERSWELPA